MQLENNDKQRLARKQEQQQRLDRYDETLELFSKFESEAADIEQKISFNEDPLSDPTEEIDAFIVRVCKKMCNYLTGTN